jgi:hypothetical protein
MNSPEPRPPAVLVALLCAALVVLTIDLCKHAGNGELSSDHVTFAAGECQQQGSVLTCSRTVEAR